ncbi:MAG: sulfotransferase family protein [Gammaproteobacteria bacterium]|nr:sulfotransferase family protein [Gammaproteobacteria bacterium]
MTLDVIGAGFGRTGTLSLRAALTDLGFGPVYHMLEVVRQPEMAADRSGVDRRAGADPRPARLSRRHRLARPPLWRLARLYPDAKVILTLRDPEQWYRSIEGTIYQVLSRPPPPGMPEAQATMARRIVLEETFQGRLGDREHAIGVFERHNREVRETVPASKLLVFDVREGWEPLCGFLGVPVPAQAFPKTNSSDEFRAMFG